MWFLMGEKFVHVITKISINCAKRKYYNNKESYLENREEFG